jgi:hypothetical protein
MTLAEEIEKAQEFYENVPPNESTTCEWVILPLLWAAGYKRYEIFSRVSDNANQYPDYTLLPDEPDRAWYLEAKAWRESLDHKHAVQCLNYANQNGTRWGALTNGHTWRLYDNHVPGPVADKLVVEARLEDREGILAFFEAISRDSVCSGRLAAYVESLRRQRERAERKSALQALLLSQLLRPDSDLIRQIRSFARKQEGLSGVTGEEIALCLQELWGCAPAPIEQPPAPAQAAPPALAQGGVSLAWLRQNSERAYGSKPTRMRFPDGTEAQVAAWIILAMELVRWLLRTRRLPPMPFRGRMGGHQYFLNAEPKHEREAMKSCGMVAEGSQTVYVHANRSAPDFVRCLHALCEAAGISPEEVVIWLRDPQGSE